MPSMTAKVPSSKCLQSLGDASPNKRDCKECCLITPPDGPLFNFCGLPKELQRNVLINMSCYSLRCLLESFPTLRGLFIIVVDALDEFGQTPVSQFFGPMLGLTVEYFTEDSTLSDYSKYLIKIFEFREICPSSPSYITIAQKGNGAFEKVFDFIDSWTIALAHVDPVCHKPQTTLTTSFAGRGARVYIDYSVFGSHSAELEYRPIDSLEVDTFQEHLNDSCIHHNQSRCLKTLDLRDVYHVHNLHLPLLKEASVQFKNGAPGELPSLHDFRAPGLRNFKVLYCDQLPVFTVIRVTDDQYEIPESFAYVQPVKGSYFALHRIASLDDNLASALLPCEHNLGTMKKGTFGNLSWSFTKHFSRIHIIGGPDKILELVSLMTASMLIWRKTDLTPTGDDQISKDVTLRINSIFHSDVAIHFETTVPETVLPKFSFYAVCIYGLIVVDRAGGLDDNGLLSTSPALLSYMKYLEIHSPTVSVSERSSTQGALVIPASLISDRGFTSLERVRMSGVLLSPELDRRSPNTRMSKGRPLFENMRGHTWEFDGSKQFSKLFNPRTGAQRVHAGVRGFIRADERRARVYLGARANL